MPLVRCRAWIALDLQNKRRFIFTVWLDRSARPPRSVHVKELVVHSGPLVRGGHAHSCHDLLSIPPAQFFRVNSRLSVNGFRDCTLIIVLGFWPHVVHPTERGGHSKLHAAKQGLLLPPVPCFRRNASEKRWPALPDQHPTRRNAAHAQCSYNSRK
jgi:hypothetical protein